MVHRSDLLRMMYEHALELGVDIKLGQEIASINEENGKVKVTTKESITYDASLVIGADGAYSRFIQATTL